MQAFSACFMKFCLALNSYKCIKNADEIIVITENGIAERGTHETLLEKNGIYAGYYNMM